MTARSVFASGSTASLTASYNDSAALPSPTTLALGSDHGHIASYYHAATDQPATPSGWTLMGGGASGTTSEWTFARRGNGTTNSITVVGATAVAAKIEMVSVSGVTVDQFWVPTTGNGQGTSNAASLASSTIVSTEAGMTAFGIIFASGTNGSSTGFAWSNGFTIRAGTSSSSTYSWAEKAIPTSGTSVSTTVTWTTSRAARIHLVLLKTTPPPSAGPTIQYRDSGGVLHSCTVQYRDSGGTLHSVTFDPRLPTTPFRIAFEQAFSVAAFTNLAIGDGATYEGYTGRTARFIGQGTPTLNGLIELPATPAPRWTYVRFQATTSDPWRDVINASTGAVITTIRIPDSAAPALPDNGDKPVGIVQPNGYSANELYKFVRLSNGNVSTTYHNANDLRGDGCQRGSRASGISFFIGTISAAEAMARNIPHTLCLAAPKELLTSHPTSADGQVVNITQSGTAYESVWPARQIDNQANVLYTNVANNIAMGSMFAIPASVDLTTLGLSADGLALATAMQDYGCHILVQSSLCALNVQPSSDTTVNARYAAMKADWISIIFDQLRRVTNNVPGTLVSNSPVSNATVAGGGVRRRDPALPLLEDQP